MKVLLSYETFSALLGSADAAETSLENVADAAVAFFAALPSEEREGLVVASESEGWRGVLTWEEVHARALASRDWWRNQATVEELVLLLRQAQEQLRQGKMDGRTYHAFRRGKWADALERAEDRRRWGRRLGRAVSALRRFARLLRPGA